VNWIATAAGSGALAVLLGAFGAHGLKGRVPAESIASWNTAVEYHLLHSVVLLALALWAGQSGAAPTPQWTMRAFFAGILLFSGSIYGLVLGGPRVLGPVTPIGGVLLISGWLSLLGLAHGHE